MPVKQIYFLYASENKNVANNIKQQLQSSYLQWNDNADIDTLQKVLANNPQKNNNTIVLALVSDNLLKSAYCMRAMSLFAQEDAVHLLLPVIIPGQKITDNSTEYYPTSINTIQDTIAYRDFWYDEWIRLRKLGNLLEGQELEALEEEKNFSKLIQALINPILRYINTAQPKNLEEFQDNNYQVLFQTLGLEALLPEERNMPLEQALTLDYVEQSTENTIHTPNIKEQQEEKVNEEVVETIIIDDEVLLPQVQEPFMLSINEILDTETLMQHKESQTEAIELVEELNNSIQNTINIENGTMAFDNILVATIEEEKKESNIEDTVHEEEHIKTESIESLSFEMNLQEEQSKAETISASNNNNNIEQLYALVDYYKEAEDYNTAAQYLEQIIQREPTQTKAFLALAELQSKNLQDINAAERTYKKVLLSADEEASIYYEYGLFLQHYQGTQQRRAIELFNAALELDSHFAPAYIALAKSYAEYGQKDMAKMNYLQACILDSTLQDIELDRSFGILRPQVEEISEITEEVIVEEIIPANPNSNTVVLVTGATAGIGKATAEKFLKEGYKVILTGRREDRLQAFKEGLSDAQQAQIQTLNFDIRDYSNIDYYLSALPEDFKNIDLLINNAGLAKGLTPIHEGNWEDWMQMIDTNIKGLLAITRSVSAQMVKNGHGHIINIGSVAAKEAYMNSNVYGATKAAVDMLTKNMRLDLHQHNIRVSAIHPGMVETEFSIVRLEDQQKANKVYENIQPLTGEDIADTIYYVATRPAHVNIQDILIFCTQQASAKDVNRSGRIE